MSRPNVESAEPVPPARRPAARRPLDVRIGSTTNALAPVSSAERSLAARPAHWIALLAIAAAAVAADQVTKHIVASNLALGDAVDIAGPFSIHHVQNSGIAFGLFSSATSIVIALTAIAVAWMVIFFARSGSRHPILPVALGLVVGGSVSNLVDRVRLGHVTDFLDLGFWPAFNLADTFIVTGLAILLATLVSIERHPTFRRPRVPRTSG